MVQFFFSQISWCKFKFENGLIFQGMDEIDGFAAPLPLLFHVSYILELVGRASDK